MRRLSTHVLYTHVLVLSVTLAQVLVLVLVLVLANFHALFST